MSVRGSASGDTIVVALDVGEQIALGVIVGGPSALADEFDLEGVEEAFHGCIIVATLGPAHRGDCADLGELIDRDHAATGKPNKVGELLRHAVARNPKLEVCILRWDLAFLEMPFRSTTLRFLFDWLSHDRIHFRLDSHHPIEACHHQKIAVIDDALAFCGGIDITMDRWDTRAHRDDEPGRRRPDGKRYRPWHDATVAVDGAAAKALGDLARERWHRAAGWTPVVPPLDLERWPADLEAGFGDVEVAIARTRAAYEGAPEVREIEALYLAAIASARRSIYLESQYFSAPVIADALARRLDEADGPDVVIVNPRSAEGWMESELMDSARAVLFERARDADAHGRLRFYTPRTAGGADIYVHAKVLVIDDTLLRVGSSNINKRSIGLDTECDLAIEVTGEGDHARRLREGIARVRDGLIAEHLGMALAEWAAVLDRADSRLAAALDAAVGAHAKTLVPFSPRPLSVAERALAQAQLDDDGVIEPMARAFRRGVEWPSAGQIAATSATLLALGGAVWLARRRRRRVRARVSSVGRDLIHQERKPSSELELASLR